MKNLLGKFPVIFIGTGIGMPMYSGNKFSKILVAQNLVTQRIPGEKAGSILLK